MPIASVEHFGVAVVQSYSLTVAAVVAAVVVVFVALAAF